MHENLSRRRFVGAAATGAAALSAAAWAAEQPSKTPATDPHAKTILDAHVHLKHGDAARTEYSAQVIVQTMDAVGIGQAIVFAMSTTTRRSIEMAEAAVCQYPQRLIPYVYALPHYERPVIQEIEAALKGGRFRGVKIHVGECTLAEYVIDPVLRLAGKCGALCLVDLGGRLDVAQRMAQGFPDTRLVIAHMGRYLAKDAALIDQFIQLAEQHRNVVLDISGVVLVWCPPPALGKMFTAVGHSPPASRGTGDR